MVAMEEEVNEQKGRPETLDTKRELLLRSIEAFLETNGFSKSLSRFRTEAGIDQINTGKGQSLDLEHVFHKYIKKRGYPAEADVVCLKAQGSKDLKSSADPNITDSPPAENVISKDKKKKKDKSMSESPDEIEDSCKSKDKKKKNSKSVSENSQVVSPPQAVNVGKTEESVGFETNGYLNKSDHGKENGSLLINSIDELEDKTPKKRKRSRIEESNPKVENGTSTKESKKRKSKDSENNMETEVSIKSARSQAEKGHLGHDKERKVKNDEDLNKSPTTPLDDLTDDQNGVKEHQNFEMNNANNTTEKSDPARSGKKEGKNSAEPKTIKAFQRVKVDEVKFADERLQNNSYWAKTGADGGYGAKAQEILGQVRGRDFRHEKTKKKRGTYRGGLIDLESHSIKFNYSDDE
ncbi:hypothetical protein QJS10_CPA01g00535 [Acorus calamus]|uniref:Srp40 C-terminal domain-containing protein n=1 Tax=Acorus calamus TaxID=4465 RepID=A0AAV9FK92_ACOCL|nr:hypothetical protein QJS10_CPA01g00535 [Acorus calamus]